jgi:hypothetical protein
VYRLTQPKDVLVDVIAWQHCSHQPRRAAWHAYQVAPTALLLGEGADNFGGDMEEEYGCDEGE